jgi:hypothetical protein
MRQAAPRGRTEDARAAACVIVAALLLASWPVIVAIVRHDGSPVGADTPVYVWWARLVGVAGSSAVAMRPGVPNVVEVVSAALGLSDTASVAALGCVLVAMIGLSGGALLRAGGESDRTPLVGLALTGLFGSYLAAGHLSNAVFAALFVLALAFVLDARRRTVAVAALLLGSAGLAHPEFLWLAIVILLGSAGLAMRVRRRREAAMVAATAVAGAAVSALGLLAASLGGAAFDVPTSLDVFLMQTHQVAPLHALFLERFRPKVGGYALWAWVPLAVAAFRRLGTPLGRMLVSWGAVSVAAVVVGLVWQPYPPHRIVAFAYCLPLLAAIGLAAIGVRIPRLAVPLAVAVIVIVGASAIVLWVDAPRPFDDPTAAAATAVVPTVEGTSGPLIVDLPTDANATGVAVIRTTNLLRVSVPAERIRDVIVRYPEPSQDSVDAQSLWRSSEDQVRRALASGPVTEVALPSPTDAVPDPALSVAGLLAAMVGWIGVCAAAGAGWCYAAGQRGVRLLERSLGVGLASLILGSSLADVVGLLLGRRPAAVGVILVVAVLGLIAALAQRREGRWGRLSSPGASTPHAYREASLP